MIVFIDMDGVLANFWKSTGTTREECKAKGEHPPAMFEKGFFRNLEVNPGAREAVTELLARGYDVHVASKPSTRNLHCATEKYEWIEEYFPELLRHKTHLIQEKGLLSGDYLIDDDLDWKKTFKGEFIHFDELNPEQAWKEVLEKLK